MHEMLELKEMLCDELNKITKQGKITSGILDTVDKLTHSIKSIETIIAMDEGGYSNRGSYAVDRRGRNADGSYMYDASYDDSYRMRADGGRDQRYSRYSRDLKKNLEDLKHEVGNDRERRMIEKWMMQLDDNY